MPQYVTLLLGLVMRLRGDEGRSCLPLFPVPTSTADVNGRSAVVIDMTTVDNHEDLDSATETYLTILYLAVVHLIVGLRDNHYEGCTSAIRSRI